MLFVVSIPFVFLLWFLVSQKEILLLEFTLLNMGSYRFSFIILLDIIRSLFFLTVRTIRISVLKFRETYISLDRYFQRFHLLLFSFILSMYLLILRPNLIRLLLGWDGLGLRSYLLVIYYSNPKAYNSGMVTALTNRIGDALILVSLAYLMKAANWNILFYSLREKSILTGSLIIVAATTKSAQIPFSAWLPAAMAAPTPVSALVHSSTLVTAGVYLLIRHNIILVSLNLARYLILMGSLTIIIARFRALFETDLKKIVALSTLSQLGVIILALGLGAFTARFFHLLRHAFFKALLFLTTGAIIHRSNNYQDLRVIGGASNSLPLTSSFCLISIISLIGFPFISAFFSKELILETILITNFNYGVFVFMLTGVFLTAIYRRRFLLLGLLLDSKNEHAIFKSDEDSLLLSRILILLVPASVGGWAMGPVLWPSLKFRSSSFGIKILILSLVFLGIFWMSKYLVRKLDYKKRAVDWAIGNMWLLPFVRARGPIKINSKISSEFNKLWERGSLVTIPHFAHSLGVLRQAVSPSLFSIQKILALIFLWVWALRIYYLCN